MGIVKGLGERKLLNDSPNVLFLIYIHIFLLAKVAVFKMGWREGLLLLQRTRVQWGVVTTACNCSPRGSDAEQFHPSGACKLTQAYARKHK